jgi:hypothetical protein
LDNLNYVITLKPESNELLENVEVANLYNSESSKKSFFLNIWKFVIYSKLIVLVANRINRKKVIQFTDTEEKILKFVSKYESFIYLNFFGVIKEINKKIRNTNLIQNPEILNDFNTNI